MKTYVVYFKSVPLTLAELRVKADFLKYDSGTALLISEHKVVALFNMDAVRAIAEELESTPPA